MGMVKSGVVLPLLTSIGRARPVLTVTVGGFLFGYEDELACITDFTPSVPDSDDVMMMKLGVLMITMTQKTSCVTKETFHLTEILLENVCGVFLGI